MKIIKWKKKGPSLGHSSTVLNMSTCFMFFFCILLLSFQFQKQNYLHFWSVRVFFNNYFACGDLCLIDLTKLITDCHISYFASAFCSL